MKNKISRGEFLKRVLLGTAAAGVFGKEMISEAATDTRVVVTDNLSSGVHVGGNPPASIREVWIDTASGGITKYYNGSQWVPTKAVWG